MVIEAVWAFEGGKGAADGGACEVPAQGDWTDGGIVYRTGSSSTKRESKMSGQ